MWRTCGQKFLMKSRLAFTKRALDFQVAEAGQVYKESTGDLQLVFFDRRNLFRIGASQYIVYSGTQK